MLLTRKEMTYDFGGARFDVARDREVLVWIFNQFLYGEVTGIQVGHWLYRAPTLDAANFLARQAVEELQHVDRFRDILALLEAEPAAPHAAVRFLSSGMMGDDWGEHVCLEMALGEGYVLNVLYALIDTVEDEAINGILRRATRQEERHVDFGEKETLRALAEDPGRRRRLEGLALVSLQGVDVLARAVRRGSSASSSSSSSSSHPVLSQFPDFLRHVLQTTETRLTRLGVLARPVSEMGFLPRWSKMALATAGHLARRYWPWKRPPLTKTYLSDKRLRIDATAG